MNTIVALLLVSSLSGGSADTPRRMAVIPIPNHAAVYNLPRGLEIHGVTDSTVSIVATDDELARLSTLGHSPRITLDDYQAWVSSVLLAYRTYAQVCSTMVALADDYPLISRLETLGFSVQNRAILMMRVTDNPQTEEAEPEFRLIGPHHGNEKIASEIALSFLQYVLASYDTSTAIRNMVDLTELWVIPIFNVDGHVANTRSNANGIDLNRDYGYRWGGEGNSPSPFSQPETRLVRQHSIDNNIAIEFEYHSTASYVNYLWDNHPADPPDSSFILSLAVEYMDSTYGSSTTELDTINGYSWYEVDGSCQDASFGLFGNIAYTIETLLPAQQARIDSICIANRRALLGIIRACHLGVTGVVRDSLTGSPLFARISIDDPLRWDCYTDQILGDFHKPLPAGAYTLTAHAQGFRPKTATGVIVPAGGAVTADFDLVPDTSGNIYVEEMVWLNHGDPNKVMPTTSIFALGAPDGRSFSLGRRGDICLSAGRRDMTENGDCTGLRPRPRGRGLSPLSVDGSHSGLSGWIRNVPGNDITVFDSDSVADGYWFYAGNDWENGDCPALSPTQGPRGTVPIFGSWTSLGHANGTTSFDLGSVGLDSARYLRIVCDSTGSSLDPKAGLDLDAVAYVTPRAPTRPPVTADTHALPVFGSSQVGRLLRATLPPASRELRIIDICGRTVRRYPTGGTRGEYTVDLSTAGLASGVYVAEIETATGVFRHKFVYAAGIPRR